MNNYSLVHEALVGLPVHDAPSLQQIANTMLRVELLPQNVNVFWRGQLAGLRRALIEYCAATDRNGRAPAISDAIAFLNRLDFEWKRQEFVRDFAEAEHAASDYDNRRSDAAVVKEIGGF